MAGDGRFCAADTVGLPFPLLKSPLLAVLAGIEGSGKIVLRMLVMPSSTAPWASAAICAAPASSLDCRMPPMLFLLDLIAS